MDKTKLTAVDRRAGQTYYVLSDSEIERLIGDAVKAGGTAAVNDFVSLLGRKTLRNVGIALAAAGTVVVNWLIHTLMGPK